MKNARMFQAPGLLFAVVLCNLLLTGCVAERETYGTVYVSHAQVFTRERLVVAREKELQFLNTSLNAQVQTNVQGAIDVRSLSAFENNLALTVSPTPAPSTVSNATPGQLTDLGKLQPASPGTLEPAKYATVGSVDHFNDAMAYRDAVNAAIREKELDDTHDQNGKTLYTLKFDTALFPGGNTHSPAFVSIEIATPQTSDTDYEALFKEWLVKLNSRLNDDEADIVARIDAANLIPADTDLVQTYLLEERDNYNAAVNAQAFPEAEKKRLTDLMNARAEYTLTFFFESPESRVAQLKLASKNSENRIALLVGMEAALLDKYRHDFGGLVSVNYRFIPLKDITEEIPTLVEYDLKLDPYHLWTPRNASENPGLPLFKQILAKWQLTPYVDSIDPQVYAQNISDVSSKIRLIDTAFALSAALGKIGNLAESARSLNETQTLLQAIKRQALAVSFATGPKFGWVLGPPFVIENGQAGFLQAATKQAFSVSVVVPVWARRLELTGYSAWLEKDGSKTNQQSLEKQSVDLPNDLDALTTAILDERTARLPTPSLFSEQPAGQFAMQAGGKEEQTLLVLGRDLWRNPQVFVSSVKADTVDLLPDMKGLLAHFKTFPTNVSNPANLTVATTFGTASLPGAVTILTPVKPKAATNSLVKLSSTFAVDASIPLTFSLATNALPAGYAGFSIKLTPPGKSADWINLDASTAPVAGTNLPVMIKPPDPQPTAPVIYTVDLGIRITPTASPVSLLSGLSATQRSFVYFPTKDQEIPRLVVPNPATITYKTDGPDPKAMVFNPASPVAQGDLYAAYLGLQKAITSKTAVLSLKAATQKSAVTLPIAATETGWSVTVPAKIEDLPADTYDTVSWVFKDTNGKTEKILISSPITVKKQ